MESLKDALEKISAQLNKAEADARIERDWRLNLQEKETKHKELINSLQTEIKKFADDARVIKIINISLNLILFI